MNALERRIREEIAASGPMRIDRYMALCLADPEHGYYMRRDPIGAEGDFTTAPEVSQIFGELIGLWAAQVWLSSGAPRPFSFIELGPGRGVLMADALRAIGRAAPAFLEAAEVLLVETSPTLRDRQKGRLRDAVAPDRIQWLDRLEQAPDRPMILVANEFFDALPIRQFERTSAGWREQTISVEDGALRFTLSDPPVPSPPALTRPGVADLAFFELNEAGEQVAAEIGRRLATRDDGRWRGAALIVDYGYDAAARTAARGADTLQAMRRHAFADPLQTPGEADLTAHVDFSALADAALAAGQSVESGAGVAPFGPLAQGSFLRRLGAEARAAALAQRNPAKAESIAAGLHRLTDPAEMGTLFKALALVCAAGGPDQTSAPPGFDQSFDQSFGPSGVRLRGRRASEDVPPAEKHPQADPSG